MCKYNIFACRCFNCRQIIVYLSCSGLTSFQFRLQQVPRFHCLDDIFDPKKNRGFQLGFRQGEDPHGSVMCDVHVAD